MMFSLLSSLLLTIPSRARILDVGAQIQKMEIPIYPTILIGLGGTGKEVLLRLRRKFFEKYGVYGFPTVSYLWIDTDVRNISIDNQKLDYIFEEVMFKPAEMVDAQIPGGEFMNYFKNPTEYPNIFDWIYSSLEVFGEVTNGAGMIRPCGRLAFFHKFPEIRAALMRANENVQTQENREVTLNRYGATVDGSRTNVYIVCSLAGGTGSGMFLDAAFLARTIVDAPSITGFLMLPSVFTPDTNDRIYANAYAALKELEFYSLRKELKEKPEEGVTEEQRTSFHDFSVEWERGRRQNIVGPPFDTCYLIDNKTKNGGIIAVEKKAQLCDMIADAIFMDFSPDVDEFALLKRSVRVNLSQFLLNDLDYAYLSDSYNETFSYRFSTFGFSKIYIPTDRIRNACTYKLAEDMVDFWLKRNNPPPDIRSFVRDNLLPKLNLQVGLVIGKGGVNDFLTNLRADEAGRTVFGVIDQWTGERRTEFQETARNKDINIFRLISDRREQFRREYFDRSDPRPERWGTIVRRIKITNKNNYLDEIKGLLRQEIANLLNDSNVRFDLVIEYLMGITRILDEYIEHFDRASRRAEAVISELSDDVAYCMDVVGVVQSDRWWFRSIGLRNYINHTVNDMQELFTRQTQLMIFETAVEVCRELKQYIGSETRVEEKDGQVTMVREGLIQELRLLQEDLVGLKASLRRKFDAFDSVEESLINQNLYRRGMFRDCYHINEREIDDATKEELEERFFAFTETGGVFALKDKIAQLGVQSVENELVQFCRGRFPEIRGSEAIMKFFDTYQTSQERTPRIQNLIDMGSGWLRQGSHFFPPIALSNIRRQTYVGIANEQHENYQRFRNEIRRRIDAEANINFVHVDPNSVCFYSEHAGIPLMYIDGLDEYKNAYIVKASQSKELHINRKEYMYSDLLLKDPKEVRVTIDANRILLLSSILRVTRIWKDKDGTFAYSYYKRVGMRREEVPLSKEYVAVEIIKREQELRYQFEQGLERTILQFEPEEYLHYYVLLDYYLEKVFPTMYYLVGDNVIEKLTQEHRVIRDEFQRIEKLLSEMYDEGQMEKAIKELRENFDEFSEVVGDERDEAPRRVLKREYYVFRF